MKKTKQNKGFTLVELIVVMAILVILAAILIPVVSGYINTANETAAYANARTVYSAACAVVADGRIPGNNAVAAGTYNTGLGDYLGTDIGGSYSYTVDANGNVTSATFTPTSGTAATYPAS